MKTILLTLAMIAFFAGNLANLAHASVVGSDCSHKVSAAASADEDCDSDKTQQTSDFEKCDDCCCHNTHSLLIIVSTAAYTSAEIEPIGILQSALRSNERTSLYRPPIA